MKYYLEPEAKEHGVTFEAPRSGDAGYDLRAAEEGALYPGEIAKIKTGLHVEIPAGCVGIIKDRSSLASLGLETHGGVIDSSYRGEILVVLENNNEIPYEVNYGKKIAQLLIVPVFNIPLQECNNLEALGETTRGAGGFGSTGVS